MDVGHVLSNFPPIIENVFKYLSQRELNNCAEVCDLWKRIAVTEKNRREDIAPIFQVLPCSCHKQFLSSYSPECLLNIKGDMESSLIKQLKELKMKPKFCLAFASKNLINNFDQFFPNFHDPSSSQTKRRRKEYSVQAIAYMKQVVETALMQHLPKKCQSIFYIAPGIIGCQLSECHFPPLELEEGCGISGLLIPSVPGLEIFNFPLDQRPWDISTLIPQNVDIKCLLVFISTYEDVNHKIVKSCLQRQNSKLALGGAFIDHSESNCGSIVAFCGESVNAASIVIKRDDRESVIETKLRLFEKTELLKDRCFAFMFSCTGRGCYFHGKYNVESLIFHKLYPKVPLIGLFGNGEIGFDYLPNIDSTHQVFQKKKSAWSRRKFTYSYTTIFVLVSLKL